MASKPAAFLLALLLAGCLSHDMNAREATAAANAELARVLPRLDRRGRTIRTSEADGKWRVIYASPDDLTAGGPVIVEVDARTRRAAIVQMPQ